MGPDEIEAIQAVAELRLQVHGHDDFGMATANTLAAVEGGAGAVSATVNGLGERAGNAPLQLVRRTAEERKRELGRFPLFHELVEGQVTNLCCFAASRRIVAVHQYRSLRRMGWEGNSILREATASTPELVEYAERLLGDSSWDGVAQVRSSSASGTEHRGTWRRTVDSGGRSRARLRSAGTSPTGHTATSPAASCHAAAAQSRQQGSGPFLPGPASSGPSPAPFALGMIAAWPERCSR